ncbi:MAG TPA: hypothetical protein VD837_18580 [Terriglobales bacterium]|nr:hypothetical protein [Terriglobales bacterium]
MRLHIQILVVVFSAAIACAQDDGRFPGSDKGGTSRGETDQGRTAGEQPGSVSVPPEIRGRSSSLISSSASRHNANLIIGGLTLMSSFDDNALTRSTNRVGDMQYVVSSSLAVEYLRPRTSWTVEYAGGVALNQKIGARNVATHAVKGEMVHTLGRHLGIALHHTYSVLSNPFTTPSMTEVHVDGDTYASGVLPTATRKMAQVGADLEWQMSPDAMIAVSGSASRLRFDSPNARFLVPSDAYGMRIYHGRQLTRRTSIGISARFQAFNFPAEHGSTTAQTIQYFHVFRLSRHFELMAYGGPQHTSTRNETIAPGFSSNDWVASGGAAIAWHRSRFTTRLGFEDTVSDGGGLTRAVRFRGYRLELQARLKRNTHLGISASTGRARALETEFAEISRFRTYLGAVYLQHQLRHDLTWNLRYEYAHQVQHAIEPINQVIDRNRVQMGFSYEFVRPWGR